MLARKAEPISPRVPNKNVTLEEQIQKLNKIGIALSSEQDLKKLLETIVREARGFTGADGGSLYIIENDRLNFTVAQTASLEKRDGKKEPFTSFYLPLTQESIAGYVAITGELLNLKDVYRVPPTVQFRINKTFDIQNNYRSKSMLVVPMQDQEGNILGVLQLINSLSKTGEVIPFKAEYESLVLSLASQAAVAIRNVTLLSEIKNLFKSLVRYSAKAIDARSPHTAGHSGRVAKYSVRLAEAVNLENDGPLGDISFSANEIEELRIAGWLHDIGKIGVRERVLEKERKLTESQLSCIRERFAAIRSSMQNAFLSKQIENLLANQKRLGSIERYQQQCQTAAAQVDADLKFITQVNSPGVLTASGLARLKQIAEKTYRDSSGNECYYLTPEEYEHLSVLRGNLTASEYHEVQSHVTHTLNILNKIQFTRDLANIPKHAAAHHEYLDGSGYPYGLKGDEISTQSRILCISDIFDALSSPDRPYKEAMPIAEALKVLRQQAAAGKLDNDLVELFIRKKLYTRPGLDEDEE